jgi:hypothetical protein
MSHAQSNNDAAQVWNPLLLDGCADLLGQLSSTNQVSVVEDIFSADGELLLAKSSVIDAGAIEFLKTQNLARPLFLSICIERTLSADDLLERLLDTIRSTEYFQALKERKYPLTSLEPLCATLANLLLVRQFLTLMEGQANDLFQRTLSVSLWSLYIAQEMHLSAADACDVFLAALTHDFGMLHLNPQILYKIEMLSADDWRHVQTHVDISVALLRYIPGVSAVVIDAVSEHHERCDGTGYPLAKVESEISLLGQIVAVADAIVGIYFNRFKAHGRRWREVIPVLEMNRSAYLYRSCELVSAMIFRSEMPLENVVEGDGVPEFAERILRQNLFLQYWFEQLQECLVSVGYTHGDRKLHALQTAALHIATTFKGGLLFKDELRESLESLMNQHESHMTQMVADASVLQQEMKFHLQRLSRMMQMYVVNGNAKDPKIIQRLADRLGKISGYIGQHNTPLDF